MTSGCSQCVVLLADRLAVRRRTAGGNGRAGPGRAGSGRGGAGRGVGSECSGGGDGNGWAGSDRVVVEAEAMAGPSRFVCLLIVY